MKATYRLTESSRLALLTPPSKKRGVATFPNDNDKINQPILSISTPDLNQAPTSIALESRDTALLRFGRLKHLYHLISRGLPAAFFCSGMALMWLMLHSS